MIPNIYTVASVFILLSKSKNRGNLNGEVVNVLDCDIFVNKFKLQSCYCIHFQTNALGKGVNPLILPVMGWIVPLLFFYKDTFGIK